MAINRGIDITIYGGDGSPQKTLNRSLRTTGNRGKTWAKNHGVLRLSAWKQGARQRLGEKGPNGKKHRVTEVVEIPELGERVAEGSKSPPFLF